MDYRKVLGIIFIILGLLFAVYPVYSAATVSWIAGICLIAFGFASIIDGFSVWSMMAHASAIKILLGICAILFGLLFIYEIDALSFLVGYIFYLTAFVMIFVGIAGIFFGFDSDILAGNSAGTLSVLTDIISAFECSVPFGDFS